jgi:Mrp family chromosome partitioning ATPase
VLLLVSPVTEIGTTTVALNLAITRASETGRRTIIVDGNLRRPAIADRLGLAQKPGLRDVIGRTASLGRAVQATGHPELWMLAAGDAIARGDPWPSADAMRTVFQQLCKQFDCVLVDGPSWDAGPEMVALAAAADAVYLVVKPPMVETPLVEDIARLIPPLGSHLGGYILTQR